jgi:hypothetical protein
MTARLARILADVMGDGEFARAMERYAGAFAAYRNRLPLIPLAHSRSRLMKTPAFEVVAMNWAPQSSSPIHDHGLSRCWVLMLEGSLDVQNYTCAAEDVGADVVRLCRTERLELRAGDVDHRLVPTELHHVYNPSRSHSAFTLQVYAQPLEAYGIVDARTQRRRDVVAVCDLDLSLENFAVESSSSPQS